jgi:hypothetical protein
MRWKLAAATAALTAALALPATAQAGHGLKLLDHEALAFTASPLAIPLAQSGGPNADGTVDIEEAGYFIPANANQWVSHVFKWQRNRNGTFTYWGVAGDFALGAGRNSVDVWKVRCRRRRARGRSQASERPGDQ